MIILADYNENNFGYICSKENDLIYVMFWWNESFDEIKKISYVSLENLYRKAKIFVNSSLKDYTIKHKSLCHFYTDFIEYYENNYITKLSS